MNNKQLYQQRVIRRKERDNPLEKILQLMNQYHSIDLMEATVEEKDWAKERLYKRIMGIARHCSKDMQGTIKASLKNKLLWEATRNTLF